MIPILYKEDETNFEHNGIGLLTDCISCITHHKRNDTFILEMKYPVFGVRRDKIVAKAIIKAKADDIHDAQLFRIYSLSKPSNGYITVKAEHISCELKDNFVESCTYEGNCIGALETLNDAAAFRTRFNFSSDIKMIGKINLERKNLWNCITGTSGSIIDTYGNGADIVRDNFNIAVKQNGGTNRKVLIEYTKNLNNFKCSEDWSNCYTKIYPYVINSETQEVFSLTDKYVDSEYIGRDYNPRILPVDFSQSYKNFSDVTEENLRSKAVAYFKNNRCDIPKLKYSLELVALSNTEEYKNAGLSEKVALFDTVIVRHKVYGIDTEIKVIEDKYNALTEKHIKLVLNDSGTSVRSELNNITNTIVDEKIDTSLKNSASVEYVNQSIADLSAAITGCDGGYVRLNPEKNPSEILVMDNEDINAAQVIWRWNKEGLGVSTTGYNGSFVGLARDGKLVVNEATAYKMTASLIEAGILKSVDSQTAFNLDTGLITLYDNVNKNYSLEIGNNQIVFFDRYDALHNQKNVVGIFSSEKVIGDTFGYHIGGDNTRYGAMYRINSGDFFIISADNIAGQPIPVVMIDNTANGSNNLCQGSRVAIRGDVVMQLSSAINFDYGNEFSGAVRGGISNGNIDIWGTNNVTVTTGNQVHLKVNNTGVEVIGTFTDSSDLAYKKNVKPLNKDTLQILKDIDIYEYEENGTTEIGLLAQEAVKVVPDIIKGDVTETTIEEANIMTEEERAEKLKDGKGASVDVYSMLSLLWDANKKLLGKIEMLENEVKILKERR